MKKVPPTRPRVKDAKALEKVYRSRVVRVIFEAIGSITFNLHSLDAIKSAISGVVFHIDDNVVDDMRDVFESQSDAHRVNMARKFKKVGIDLSAVIDESLTRQLIEQRIGENASLIQRLTGKSKDRFVQFLQTEVTLDRNKIQRELVEQHGMAKRHARVIARDQTSKLSGALTEARQRNAGVRKYQWSTSGDERVRDSHKALDGQTFDWNKPPSVGHPREDIMCRCDAIAIIE